MSEQLYERAHSQSRYSQAERAKDPFLLRAEFDMSIWLEARVPPEFRSQVKQSSHTDHDGVLIVDRWVDIPVSGKEAPAMPPRNPKRRKRLEERKLTEVQRKLRREVMLGKLKKRYGAVDMEVFDG